MGREIRIDPEFSSTQARVGILLVLGAVIKLGLFLGLDPDAPRQWYVPFMEISSGAPSLDPWTTWLSTGGDPLAFPYGLSMWGFLLPASVAAVQTHVDPSLAYLFTLLIFDSLLLLVLVRILNVNLEQRIVTLYWFSPIILGATYALGLNDIIPVFLLISTLLLLSRQKPVPAGITLALAISAKVSMVLAMPFLLIYLWNNSALRVLFAKFFVALLGATIALSSIGLLSQGYREMLTTNPELTKIFSLNVKLAVGNLFYLVPLVYLTLLYFTWRVRRPNLELITSIMGLAFLPVILLSGGSPGWFVWLVPFLVIYEFRSDVIAALLVALFSLTYVLLFVVAPELSLSLYTPVTGVGQTEVTVDGLGTTLLIATAVVLAVRIFRQSVGDNDFFRFSRKPFSIGIAGDSGSGKDTLATSLIGLFGKHSVTHLSGDGYHHWNRAEPMWSIMTHLNPSANDLERFVADAGALCTGETAAVTTYDHSLGRIGPRQITRANDVVIVSGLHALYSPALRELLDVSIFLDMDEGLRQKLKLDRDVAERGHTRAEALALLGQRELDASRFIRPQRANADLIFSLLPIHPAMLVENYKPLRFKLLAQSRYGFSDQGLIRALIGICGLHVDLTLGGTPLEDVLTVEGESQARDLEVVARRLYPKIIAFLDLIPMWHSGALGLMQLITLQHINRTLQVSLSRR